MRASNINDNARKVLAFIDSLISAFMELISVRLTGDPTNGLHGITFIAIEGVEGDSVVMMLDQNCICASSG